MNALLIVGTEAGTGKTVLLSALAAYWQRYGGDRPLGIFKPIQCGGTDRDRYVQQFGLSQTVDEVNPCWFESSLVPPLAAEQAGRKIKLDKLWQSFESLSHQREFVLVEGCGGLGDPVSRETTMADLAWDWRLPTVLVVPVTPGAIAQAVANAALAEQANVHLKGIVLNCLSPDSESHAEDWAPTHLLQSLTHKPVLGCIPHLADPGDRDKLAQAASNLELERLLPLL
ncbi:MAG TPA: dethiobiotin synthase [Chroococcidiopsis sp.]